MSVIVGIDEVGRGCWAGPLVACAAILLQPTLGLNDSKLLSPKKRDELAVVLESNAHYGLGWVSPAEVDELGLSQAVGLAMRRAIEKIQLQYDQIIIDGQINFLPHLPNVKTLIKADQLIEAVSAASIVAKVARDKHMAQMAIEYPGYGFEKHVGYGTPQHQEALAYLGPTSIHRKSYKPVKAYL